jgi:hypothetical protein
MALNPQVPGNHSAANVGVSDFPVPIGPREQIFDQPSKINVSMMNHRVLPKVEEEIRKYKTDHKGEMPLYIIVSPHEADDLLEEVKAATGYDAETLVTTYQGSKIIKHDSLNKGDLRLSNELPGD